jgi:hypothetical protein
MRAKEVLSPQDYDRYQQGWAGFQAKNKLESKFNVHSSVPAVSWPYTFTSGDISVGRVRVFQGFLRGTDPYAVTCKYANPFWHPVHYFISTEQAYHATTNKIRDNSRHVLKDAVDTMKMKVPVFWEDPVSIEVTLKKGIQPKGFLFMEHVTFTVLKNDRLPAAQMEVRAYANLRAYLRDLDTINNSKDAEEKEAARQSLINKVNMQGVKHTVWGIDRRTNMKARQEELLADIMRGTVSESALYDFFSLWDIPKGTRMGRSGPTSPGSQNLN